MDKNNLYLDKIEDFDENNLPDIELSEKELIRIKSNLMGIINQLKDKNKSLDFKITLDEALKIKNELGKNYNRPIYYNKDANLMREMITKTISEEEHIKNKVILSELIIPIRANAWWWNTAVCYQLFITDMELIIYSFDSQYKIINNYRIKLPLIEGAGTTDKSRKILDDDEQIIMLPGTIISLNPNYGGKREELLDFIETLRSQGVKDIDRTKFDWTSLIMKLIWICIIFTIIYLTIDVLNL